MSRKALFATSSALRVHRSIARRLRAPASASSFSTPASSTTRTATAQTTESTSKLLETPRVVLIQASVFHQLLSRLSSKRRNGHLKKRPFRYDRGPSCRPLVGASASSSGFGIILFNPITIDNANGRCSGNRVNAQTTNTAPIGLSPSQ